MDTPTDREVKASISCRLCGSEARLYGQQTVRERYRVAYYECGECKSLQTEEPYWLEEAYRVKGVGLDVGACQRCLGLSIDVSACLTVLGFDRERACLDYGSGLGLFSRLMRDRGFNFRAYDKFIMPFFMDRYVGELSAGKWAALTAFEVLEHMVTPERECAELFQADPDVIFFTTQIWKGQGLDWWFIVPLGGQHIFFFSDKALQMLAAKHDFTLIDLRSVKVFLNNRIAKTAREFSTVEKMGYALDKPRWQKGKNLPEDITSQLHLLKDRKAMRRLALHLFAQHQKDAFRFSDEDFRKLTLPASGIE